MLSNSLRAPLIAALGKAPLSVSGAACILALATFLAPVSSADAQDDFCLMGTNAGGCCNDGVGCQPLRWTRRCLSIAIDVDGTPSLDRTTVDRIVDDSFQRWVNIPCASGGPNFELQLLGEPAICNRSEFNVDDSNVNTIAFISADEWIARENEPRAYALTTVWHNTSTGIIFDADMELNENRGPYVECPEPAGCMAMTNVDLENVITHEAGHFFGLGHSANPNATMYFMSPAGEIERRTLDADDENAFCTLYPTAVDGSCDFDPVGGLDLNCEDDEGCGCRVMTAPEDWAAEGLTLSGLALILIGGRRFRRR